LVVGGAGYIGEAVCRAFRRYGFDTYASCKPEQSKALHKLEIRTVPTFDDKFDRAKLEEFHIIVDAVGGQEKLFDTVVQINSKRAKPFRQVFIATGGILVFSSTQTKTEDDQPNNQWMKQRIEFNLKVVSTEGVRGIVLRPGWIFGGNGGKHNFFGVKPDEELVILGNKDRTYSWVHIEDVAEVYVLAARAGPLADHQIFDVVSPITATFEEVKIAEAKAAGWKGKVKYVSEVPKEDWWGNASNVTAVCAGEKAQYLLGWKPKHLHFLENIDLYYQSYKASQS